MGQFSVENPALTGSVLRGNQHEEKRAGLPVLVHVCFEAGRDGHWLYRALKAEGYDVYEIDPASVAVDRRARRAKSDGVDVDKLVRTLSRLVRGELDACRVVEVPSPEEEDAKRPHREYERLVKERTSHSNRVKALLFAQGMRAFHPIARDWPARLAGLPIPPRLKAELIRECRRLERIVGDIAEVEAAMTAVVVPAKKARTKDAALSSPSQGPREVQDKVEQLYRLRGIGVHFSTVLGGEVFYRKFRNRRSVGQYIGLAPSPFQSGDMAREQGIAKAGNGRARKAMTELAWLWLRHQPESAHTRWFNERVGERKGRVLIVLEADTGPISGDRMIGTFSKSGLDRLIVKIETVEHRGKSLEANGIVIAPDSMETAVATSIDQHYVERFVLPAAAAFISGLGQAVALSNSTTTVSPFGGTTQTFGPLSVKEQAMVAGGAAATAVSNAMTSSIPKGPTVHLAANVSVGVMFLSNVSIK